MYNRCEEKMLLSILLLFFVLPMHSAEEAPKKTEDIKPVFKFEPIVGDSVPKFSDAILAGIGTIVDTQKEEARETEDSGAASMKRGVRIGTNPVSRPQTQTPMSKLDFDFWLNFPDPEIRYCDLVTGKFYSVLKIYPKIQEYKESSSADE